MLQFDKTWTTAAHDTLRNDPNSSSGQCVLTVAQINLFFSALLTLLASSGVLLAQAAAKPDQFLIGIWGTEQSFGPFRTWHPDDRRSPGPLARRNCRF